MEKEKKNLGKPEGAHRDLYQEDLQRRISIDRLSGLLNRDTTERYIKERLEQMSQEETCALFMVDLDNFKMVNDVLGHPAGDEAIRQAARILSGLFRANDIVGRLGGDEFAVFLCGNVTEKSAMEKAAAICESLQLTLGNRETVEITASVGVYLADRGDKFEGLYQSADLALYKAKKAGKHQFCLKNKNQDSTQGGGLRPASVISLGVLLENMESGVALLEMGGMPQITYVSPSFCRILGTGVEEFRLPMSLADLIHPDDLPSVLSVLQEGAAQDRVVESTHRVRSGEGKGWLWWQVRAAKMEYRDESSVMLITATDVSRLKETQHDQESQIQRLQTAFTMTAWHIWEVDLSTRVFQSDLQKGDSALPGGSPMLFPDSLIGNGWLHPESLPRFRLFAEELLKGSVCGFGNFAVRHQVNGCFGWFTFSYRTLFDDVGRAVRAVGVMEELPGSFTGEDSWLIERHRLPENLIADLLMQMRADLTLDTVESMWAEGTALDGQTASCSEVLEAERQRVFCRGDQQEFLAGFHRDALLRLYRSGRRWLCAEYRRADLGGNIRWVRHILYLTEDPKSRHIYLFVYIIRLDPDRRLEQTLCADPRRDPVSRLYSRDTVQRMAETLFADRRRGNRGVAVLQVGGIEALPQGPERDRLLYGLSAGLSLVLGGGCLLGQYSPNQIVIVFPDVTDKDGLRRRTEESGVTLRRMLAQEPAYRQMRFVVGADIAPAATANYRFMLGRALETCACQWDAAADTMAFAQDREEQDELDWARLQGGGAVSAWAKGGERPLSDQEKGLALDVVSAMLVAKNLDASLFGALRAIGTYHRADRAYFLMVTEDRNAVIMPCEWTNGVKRSIQRVVSGMPLEKFPLLVRCMGERSPVFLSRSGGRESGSSWHFAAFPLLYGEEQRAVGFLCIDNARNPPVDGAVFSVLSPLILQQRERFQGGEHPAVVTKRLAEMPGLPAYLDALPTINSDYYSTMGAVCLDIPGLSVFGSSQVGEHSCRMLWYAVNALSELFGHTLLFRIREAEFTAFYPNSTREVFFGRCGRLWTLLQRRYPRQMRIGQAWAEGTFTGEGLVGKANAAMRGAQGDWPAQDLPGMIEGPASGGAGQNRQFTVYFQPKVDMRDGSLAGAEALVRQVAEDGTVTSPAQFIPLMEETGAIRELDLFVLARSLAQVEKWRAAGLGVVPISVNLSRTTLAHPATLAAVLAIQSRYPDIPGEALELEITERGDQLGTSELQYFVERFRACGLRTSLDDFGSQYANLSLFTNVSFETVKLDKSLIDNLGGNLISRMLVRDLVEICRACHMTFVVEGVETREQIDALLELGAIYAQGFYYDRPLPPDEFEEKYLRGAGPSQDD